MKRRWLRALAIAASLLICLAGVTASIAVPVVLLWHTDGRTLDRWSQIGQAISPVGVFFSGVAFVAIGLTLFYQAWELRNQREELAIALEEQRRGGEIALRQLHTDLMIHGVGPRRHVAGGVAGAGRLCGCW